MYESGGLIVCNFDAFVASLAELPEPGKTPHSEAGARPGMLPS